MTTILTITVPGEPKSQDRRTRQLRAYEVACVYVRCFCDQFKTSPQQAWESPGGVAPTDAEKHTK